MLRYFLYPYAFYCSFFRISLLVLLKQFWFSITTYLFVGGLHLRLMYDIFGTAIGRGEVSSRGINASEQRHRHNGAWGRSKQIMNALGHCIWRSNSRRCSNARSIFFIDMVQIQARSPESFVQRTSHHVPGCRRTANSYLEFCPHSTRSTQPSPSSASSCRTCSDLSYAR
jgi:hypothetical protein